MAQDSSSKPLYVGKIAQNYEKWYDTPYGKHADKLEKDMFVHLVKPKKGQSILAVGCGTGHFAFWFHSLGLKVTGIDISPDMLGIARAIKQEKSITDIAFMQKDASKLSFSDNSFDIVALITTLEFLAQPEQALQEAFRVSRKKIFLGVLNQWSFLSFKRKLKSLFTKNKWGEVRFYSFRGLKRLINRCSNTYTDLHYQKTLRGAFIGLVVNL